MRVMVAGAGGFIGGHLVKRLLAEGHDVHAVDIKAEQEWYQLHTGASWRSADLSRWEVCVNSLAGVDQVYHLAADMGGMGFIETHQADCMFSSLITGNLLRAALETGVSRLFYASSACVYAAGKQRIPGVTALREEDAWPAEPERGYGLEKLFGEQFCELVSQDYPLVTRVARYHNVYGPNGTWDGGREKAPAAICRKVIAAKKSGVHEIEIWGDGEQTRSFMYIDDCITGTLRLMDSDYGMPVNIGSSEMVTINQLVDVAEAFAGITLKRSYNLTAPQGVRGRNSDNTLLRKITGWEPSTSLNLGLAETYRWIWDEMSR